MSLVLLAVGTVLVSIALFNKLPHYVPGRLPAPGAGRAAGGGAVPSAARGLSAAEAGETGAGPPAGDRGRGADEAGHGRAGAL
ncbi:hypothetical protein Q7689_29965 [Nocardiopsis tropica]|nr:hypothetical protein [Nocardiopsis tropica]